MSQTPNNTQSWSSTPQFPNNTASTGMGIPPQNSPGSPPPQSHGMGIPMQKPGGQGQNTGGWGSFWQAIAPMLQQFLGGQFQPGQTPPVPGQGAPGQTPPTSHPLGIPQPPTPGNPAGPFASAQGNPFLATSRNTDFHGPRFLPGGRTPGNNWFNPTTGKIHRGDGSEVPVSMQGQEPGWMGTGGRWNELRNIWSGQYPGAPQNPSILPPPARRTPINPSIPEQPQTT